MIAMRSHANPVPFSMLLPTLRRHGQGLFIYLITREISKRKALPALWQGFRFAFSLHPIASARLSLCVRIAVFPAPMQYSVPIARRTLPFQQTPSGNAEPSRFNDIAKAWRR